MASYRVKTQAETFKNIPNCAGGKIKKTEEEGGKYKTHTRKI